MKHVWLFTCVLLMLICDVKAQKNAKSEIKLGSQNVKTELSPFSLTLKTGLTQFFGELNEQDMKGAVGVGVSGKISRGISLGLDYSAGKVGGQKSNFFNSYFITEYNTAEFIARWNLTRQFSKRKYNDFEIGIYGGAGIIFFSANAFDLTTNELVRFSNSERSKRNQLFLRWGNPRGREGIKKTHERIIPVGTTLDYNLSDNWKIGLDYRFYLVRTDKVDATSGQRLINPEEGDSYSDTPNDKFSLFAVTLTHCFAKPRRH
ncbi:hypothetical protein [Dyadobacter psychrotolerans]|uniref:Outer membrane protein beta-barrel domain-containing protein n=1 Tax=Dyadobacter psychrotolerans TaxID=2541721 RepID=A0A4R5DP20_9BACT|nr:hypothetical protein [Dyadobacter psychrotolerans]TDE13761.1 hypothetical protein E0F88_17840 [Dyadobacter psychrotolerans]